MIIDVEIEGVTPLLMAKFNIDVLSEPKKKNKNVTKEEFAEELAYRNKDGELFVPGFNVFRTIMEGGRFVKNGKSKVTTLKNSMIGAGVTFLTEECLLNKKEYEISTMSAVNRVMGDARIIVHRPIFKEWKISFAIDVDEEMFSSTLIKEVIESSGKRIGLGAFRPDRKGTFGKFKIIKFIVRN